MRWATSSVDPVEVPKKIPTLEPKSAVAKEEDGRLEGSGENATHTSGTEDMKAHAVTLRNKSDEERYLNMIDDLTNRLIQ